MTPTSYMGSYEEGQTPLVEFEWWSSGAAVAFQFRKNLPILQFVRMFDILSVHGQVEDR